MSSLWSPASSRQLAERDTFIVRVLLFPFHFTRLIEVIALKADSWIQDQRSIPVLGNATISAYLVEPSLSRQYTSSKQVNFLSLRSLINSNLIRW
ncbi:unnamed protein product [Nezara viridula]|uniref:Uncharacterized protein n=1 Tax=Nezara viridula TaxID=85310 RepID=A0A9P0HS35_NEZVI|nr:unnamed protein product [Nezara viridula]